MLSRTARRRAQQTANRLQQRLSNEELLERAAYLPLTDRLLVEQVLAHGIPLSSLARVHRSSPSGLRRRFRRLRATLADPCFLLTTHFADRLPEELRPVARSYFVDQLTLRQCAARHHTTLHHIRQAVGLARTLLWMKAREEHEKQLKS